MNAIVLLLASSENNLLQINNNKNFRHVLAKGTNIILGVNFFFHFFRWFCPSLCVKTRLPKIWAIPKKLIGYFRVPGPLFQNEGRRSAFDVEIIFHSHANKTPLHKKGCAPFLILKVRVFGTRKWPINFLYCFLVVVVVVEYIFLAINSFLTHICYICSTHN